MPLPTKKLLLSLLIGWGIVTYVLYWFIVQGFQFEEWDVYLSMLLILFAIRYSLFKPAIKVLGAAATGWAMWSIWEFISGTRENSTAPIVFFTMLILGLAFVFIKGATLAIYFFPKENIELFRYYKQKKSRNSRKTTQYQRPYVVK